LPFRIRDEEIKQDRNFPVFSAESKFINIEEFYKYSVFKSLSRNNYISTVNLPDIFTNSLKLFHLFFPREIMEGFVRVINTYAEIKRQKIFEIPKFANIRFRK
jgi:hypothetical protein